MANTTANTKVYAASTHVFTYGSLMFEAVWQRVALGHYSSALATLNGFERFQVRHATYPAVVRSPSSRLTGRVYFDVLPDDIKKLDAFEGTQYERISVSALVQDGPHQERVVNCGIYLFTDLDNLSDKPWDEQWFAQVGIHEFMRTYCVEKGV